MKTIEWHEDISIERALKILGAASVDEASRMCGSSHGAWMANEPELYAAWRAVERVRKGV